eukprot:CAMPEP_0168621848 /NCGR_PEP_ID=MMETSP0449_2-20121227/7928_1 /TAXON_ID=1082188 /ORGANISM="Strombidium rassoulzadegani, Strain ras09" /LENGTH=78 /DNA_ID=CAMNT_0008663025 /DNA_START=12 /DNA_END=248 /DNA_ORIENTATION=-
MTGSLFGYKFQFDPELKQIVESELLLLAQGENTITNVRTADSPDDPEGKFLLIFGDTKGFLNVFMGEGDDLDSYTEQF